MIIKTYPQGSIDWVLGRLPRLTASTAKKNITANGSLSKSEAAMKSIDRLIAAKMYIDKLKERPELKASLSELDDWQLQDQLAHFVADKFKGSVHTLRGNDYEHEAVAALCEKVGEQFYDVGMVIMGDCEDGRVSCSPDAQTKRNGIINQGAEVKSPALCTYLSYVHDDILPKDHEMQVHFSMAVCDVDVWHFGAKFVGFPLFYKKVQRDAFTDKLQTSLIEFEDVYKEREEIVINNLNALTRDIF